MEKLVRKDKAAKKEPYKTFDLQMLSGCHIVHLHNESVLTMESLEETKRELFDMVETAKPLHLIVNFASVQRCSSAAVNVLLHLYVDIKATQTQMSLCGVRDSIREVFRVLSLEGKVFKIYDSVQTALRAVEMA